MNNLNEGQLEFVKHMVHLAKEAINYEYFQGDSEGLSPDAIGEIVYKSAVQNPVVVLETYIELFNK